MMTPESRFMIIIASVSEDLGDEGPFIGLETIRKPHPRIQDAQSASCYWPTTALKVIQGYWEC